MAPRISDALWEHHRETIVDLFIRKDIKLSGSGGVIDLMRQHHGFQASLSQYEARFKQWRLRKKITEGEWRAILPRVEKRAKQGRRTEVIFNCLILDEGRVQRELARRSSTNLRAQFLDDAHEPDTPPGFAIQSPPPDDIASITPLATEMEITEISGTTKDNYVKHTEQSEPFAATRSLEKHHHAVTVSSAPTNTTIDSVYQHQKDTYSENVMANQLPHPDGTMLLNYFLAWRESERSAENERGNPQTRPILHGLCFTCLSLASEGLIDLNCSICP